MRLSKIIQRRILKVATRGALRKRHRLQCDYLIKRVLDTVEVKVHISK